MALDDVVREIRQRFRAKHRQHGEPGQLGYELQRIANDYAAARANGLPRAEGIRGITAALKALWKFPTTQYPPECGRCEGIGYELVRCDADHRCGRRLCRLAHDAHEHDYVVPCSCPSGDRRRKRPPQADDGDLRTSRQQRGRMRVPR